MTLPTAQSNNVFLPEHKIVIFCVTKAANTSIKLNVIKALINIKDPLTRDRWEGSDAPWVNTHRHPSLRRTPLPRIVADPRTTHAFKAAFVRNPFDRLVSCYTEKVLGGHELKGVQTSSDMSFAQFVDAVCNTSDDEADIHYESQHRFFVWSGVVLADFIGSVEDVDEHWERVRHQTPLPLRPLRKKNASPSRGRYEEYYSPELIRRVERRYARDLELLGYRFDRLRSERLPLFTAEAPPRLAGFDMDPLNASVRLADTRARVDAAHESQADRVRRRWRKLRREPTRFLSDSRHPALQWLGRRLVEPRAGDE